MSKKNTSPKTGRPPFVPTPEMRAAVAALAGGGLSAERIAQVLSASGTAITGPTVRRHFAEELTAGSARIEAQAISTLVSAMRRGSVSAASFWLTRRCGWTNGVAITLERPTEVAQAEAMASVKEILDELAQAKRNGSISSEEMAAFVAVAETRH